ncbi:MAG: hypothetical protein LUF30_02865 [Lachnospiraceae bacterium]|nr:hypothetical protein [Lachnospiraceae bacterium]
MIAHRGVSALETENTAAAFVAAGNRSYYGVETDIWRTLDGKFICNHDGNSGRICGQNLTMEQSTLPDLRELTLNDLDGKADRSDLKLCMPEEYFKICCHYGKVCIVELKSSFHMDEIQRIVEIFEGYLDQTVFISFQMRNLELIKKLRPLQECQYLTSKYEEDLPRILAIKKMGVDIHYKALTRERIDLFHRAGVEVNCWTVDDPHVAQMLIDSGVDYITSNLLE